MPIQSYLKKGGMSTLVLILLALLSIKFIDRPLTLYIHVHGLDDWLFLRYITEQGFQTLAIICIIILCIFPTHKKLSSRLIFLVYVIAIVYLTQLIRAKIGIICGRNWPKTWLGSGIYGSLVSDGNFSFHFFQSDSWSGSFPSGHSARTATLSLTMFLIYNHFKYFWLFFIAAMLVSLVILDYHYLGDCLGGIALAVFLSYYGFSIYLWLCSKTKNWLA